MPMPKVLISDKMNPLAEEIFQNNGIDVDVKPGMSPDQLKQIIGEYDGLAVRSSTKVTPDILGAAGNLKVIGRAGIGVDNIDVTAATEAGIVVMNTPYGNSITTAEHAIAMMFAVCRQIPQANESTHAGKWEKSRFMGVELYGKTLGVLGCGNIGSIVASRGIGLKMNVIAFDPFLSPENAAKMGVKKVELDELFEKSDFITIHTPLNDKTRGIVGKDAFAKMKDGVRIINCARGGLVVESDLLDALNSGKVAGAALDVFEQEPATDNALFGHDNVVCTPHLGASTSEAQVNVAIQVAEQMTDFLLEGAVTNALNMPSISAEEAPLLQPYLALAEQLGSFSGQITQASVQKIEIEFQGEASEVNIKPLTSTVLSNFLRPLLDSVNMVNARQVATARGIEVSETQTESCPQFKTAIKVTTTTENRKRSVTGTLFASGEPRIVNIEGVQIEGAIAGHMLYIINKDQPGMIGGVGTILAEAGQNISDFRLGRHEDKDTAVALVSLDAPVPDDVFEKLKALPQIELIKRLKF